MIFLIIYLLLGIVGIKLRADKCREDMFDDHYLYPILTRRDKIKILLFWPYYLWRILVLGLINTIS